jgi:hypothetical protein
LSFIKFVLLFGRFTMMLKHHRYSGLSACRPHVLCSSNMTMCRYKEAARWRPSFIEFYSARIHQVNAAALTAIHATASVRKIRRRNTAPEDNRQVRVVRCYCLFSDLRMQRHKLALAELTRLYRAVKEGATTAGDLRKSSPCARCRFMSGRQPEENRANPIVVAYHGRIYVVQRPLWTLSETDNPAKPAKPAKPGRY